ncbi:MAG TPA: peptidylprolyl isomerase [Bacteroidales bacterium]|nr:peptidylprolyl isomerase [Bacteroidales bacterium]
MRHHTKFTVLFILFFSSVLTVANAQKLVDQIVAVVGDKIILQSDIENQYLQLRAQGISGSADMKCDILNNFLTQKLLVNQAEIDSVVVPETQVEMELNQRLDYFVNQIGSQEKLEEYFNKSMLEIKEDFREIVREQQITQQMQRNIVGEVSVTPSEVKEFYHSLPKDSIPYINSKVEVSQILRYPPYGDQAVYDVKQRLLELRKRIMNGEDFATLAILYSEGPSAPKGGDIGYLGKGELDPAYAKAAFSLKKGGVSTIVESAFGYHIIQLVDRKDDKVHTRHILMKPKVSPQAILETKNKLDSIATLVREDSMTFDIAAKRFSQDKNTFMNGGVVVNQKTGDTRFEMDDFSPEEYRAIRNLNPGDISEPFETTDENGKKVYKIVKLRTRTEPHRANLKEDYMYLQDMAIAHKKQEILANWIAEKRKETYISIDDSFKNCPFLKSGWIK